MKLQHLTCLLLVATVFAAWPAWAQIPPVYDDLEGPLFDDWAYRPSTAAESYARGFADVVRAQGQYELYNSAAAKNYAEARNAEIDNRYRYTKMYFELQQINRNYRAQLRGPRATEEQLIRFAQAGAPAKLTTQQLDRYTGDIRWPQMLQTENFAKQRQLIDQVFASRVLNEGYIAAEDYAVLQQSIEQMRMMLKEEIHDVPTAQYLEARSFLDSLDYESTL